ncbi:unnamed protein product [Rangifer tarandus platyrhynchus]|uniref:Uncharacterized protein n=1 Tax=Rangifer tarandus platyrhynchus TaxID=3082113 RepID=A0AC59YES7_RANTA
MGLEEDKPLPGAEDGMMMNVPEHTTGGPHSREPACLNLLLALRRVCTKEWVEAAQEAEHKPACTRDLSLEFRPGLQSSGRQQWVCSPGSQETLLQPSEAEPASALLWTSHSFYYYYKCYITVHLRHRIIVKNKIKICESD